MSIDLILFKFLQRHARQGWVGSQLGGALKTEPDQRYNSRISLLPNLADFPRLFKEDFPILRGNHAFYHLIFRRSRQFFPTLQLFRQRSKKFPVEEIVSRLFSLGPDCVALV